jgi:hypothetical protein
LRGFYSQHWKPSTPATDFRPDFWPRAHHRRQRDIFLRIAAQPMPKMTSNRPVLMRRIMPESPHRPLRPLILGFAAQRNHLHQGITP